MSQAYAPPSGSSLVVPVLSANDIRAWPKHPEGGHARPTYLYDALTHVYRVDAHTTQYACPTIQRRLDQTVLQQPHALPYAGPDPSAHPPGSPNAGVTMQLAVFDVDDPVAHATKAPKTDGWFHPELAKLNALANHHPNLFIYGTRGGYRIVATLPTPIVLSEPEHADVWTRTYHTWRVYLHRHFGIQVDPTADWQRLFRLPFATRDGNEHPERPEILGSPHNIGIWHPHLSPEVRAEGQVNARKAKAVPTTSSNYSEPTARLADPNANPMGVLYHLLEARGAIRQELEGLSKWAIECPKAHEHSSDSPSGTILYAAKPPTLGLSNEVIEPGSVWGWIKCSHTSAEHDLHSIKDWLKCFTPAEIEQAKHIAGVVELNPTPNDPSMLAPVGVDQIFAPLPAVPWLIENLDMCPGAPTLVAGYGYSGKTLAVQSMAVAVATGQPIWGRFKARQGKVLHIDLEQGSRLTFDRYQRLAKGAGIHRDQLAGMLEVAPLPTWRLTAAKALETLVRACEGVSLCIIDSMRAACPGADENSSEIRQYLDLLGAVSDRTQTTFLVIHHARKPNADSPGGARMAIRGSSAIYDACASVLVFEGAKGEPAKVSHDKARVSGITHDDFGLLIADVPMHPDARGGLKVVFEDSATTDVRKAAKEQQQRELFETQLHAVIASNPGCSLTYLRDNVKARNEKIGAALESLTKSGKVVAGGAANKQAYYVHSGTSPAPMQAPPAYPPPPQHQPPIYPPRA